MPTKIYAFITLMLFFNVSPDSIKEDIDEEVVVPALVEQEIQRRIAAFKAKRMERCLEELKAEAEAYVDSTIVNDIYVEVMDSLIFPERPIRPPYRGKIILDDTTMQPYKRYDR